MKAFLSRLVAAAAKYLRPTAGEAKFIRWSIYVFAGIFSTLGIMSCVVYYQQWQFLNDPTFFSIDRYAFSNIGNLRITAYKSVPGSRNPLGDGSDPGDSARMYIVFAPSDFDISKLSIPASDFVSVERTDEMWANVPGYDGYDLYFRLAKSAPIMTSVSYLGKKIDMESSHQRVLDYEPVDKDALFEESRARKRPLIKRLNEFGYRVFLPKGNSTAALAWATGRPVFEEDFYRRSKWIGSFVAWRSEADANRSSIETWDGNLRPCAAEAVESKVDPASVEAPVSAPGPGKLVMGKTAPEPG